MPEVKVQQHIKVHNVVNEFPAKFSKTPMNELFCKLCECIVTCSKKFFVDSHSQMTLRNQKTAYECVDVLSVNVWMYTIHFVYAFFLFYFGYS